MPVQKEKIKAILKRLPHAPGIYKMLSKNNEIIYIGKAKDLNKRVKQYFQKNYQHSTRTEKLLEKIEDIRFTAVDSELEATILETNLIKEFNPKYNVIMKDDKNFVYIKITNEQFPRIQITRKVEKDDAKYFGPKSAANKVKETFKVLKKIFPFRHCNLDIEYIEPTQTDHKVKVTNKTIKFPCLDYYIKRCIAPCIGKCSPNEYQTIIKNIENFLQGKADNILNDLEKQMQNFAQNRNFEKAAKIRDKISKIKNILEKQRVADPNQTDKDIVNYCITQDNAYFNLFQVRDGKLIGQENFTLKAHDINENEEDPEVLESFITQYYTVATDIPKEILIPHTLENQKTLETFISTQANKKSKLIIPQKGDKNRLLEMCAKNARIFADRNKTNWQKASDLTEKAAKELQETLRINSSLNRIEYYDISHLSGTDTVGSMVVFEKGAPKPGMYRKFQLKTVQGKPDDCKSMKEVLLRRFQKIALIFLHKDLEFKKIRKKDKEFIEKNNKIKLDDTDRQFFVAEDIKKSIGFIALNEHSNKVSELTNLWVHPNVRGKKAGYFLMKNAIKKSKSKRIYIICKQELKEYYLLFGFEEIKKLPEELKNHKKQCRKERKIASPLCLVYDKNKHKEDESFSRIPDLVVIDGGKGQLKTAENVFSELNLKIPHIALAKRLEEIYMPGKKEPLVLARTNEALKLLQRGRDEAHRFAISYNKKLRQNYHTRNSI